MGFAVVAHQASETNLALASRGWAGARGQLLAPRDALRRLRPGDVALNRLDVLPTLDGVEEGLWIVSQLEAHGVRVLNPPSALLSAHDKLLTARLLESAGLPHPRTARLTCAASAAGFRFPVVAKPRFGSWGRDVHLAVLGLDLAGIDLLPVPEGYVVLEVNGAVDFRPHYSETRDVYAAALDALAGGTALLTP